MATYRKFKCDKCGRTVSHRLVKVKDDNNPAPMEWKAVRHGSEYRRGNEMNTRICGEQTK